MAPWTGQNTGTVSAPSNGDVKLLMMMIVRRVAGKASGIRLDQFLSQGEDPISRTRAKWLIDLGAVYIEGSRSRVASRLVKKGETIAFYPVEPALVSLFRISPGDILFEDSHLLVLNKPAGVNSQPTRPQYKGCAYEAVEAYLRSSGKPGAQTIGMPQRLDRDVSGVMLFTLSRMAHKAVTEAFRNRMVGKSYVAICDSKNYIGPREGEISGSIQRMQSKNRFGVAPSGKPATTRFRTLCVRDRYALLETEPITGRTHQIRIHLASAGFPILGDRVYGILPSSEEGGKARPLLHAFRLEIPHPASGENMVFEAPLPRDMAQTMLKRGLVRPE